MRHVLLAALAAGLNLLATGTARADSPTPYPGHVAASKDGRWYVLVRPGTTAELRLVQRAAGRPAPPAFPAPGVPVWELPRVPAPEAGDTVVGVTKCRAPGHAFCRDGGRGAVLVDSWWPRGRGEIIQVIDARGQPAHRLSLKDVFPATEVARFPRSVAHILWLRGAWLDPLRDHLVVVGVGEVARVIVLGDGSVRPLRPDDLTAVLARGAAADHVLVLDAAIAAGLRAEPAVLAKVPSAEAPVRVRLDLLAAMAGGEAARERLASRLKKGSDTAPPILLANLDRVLPAGGALAGMLQSMGRRPAEASNLRAAWIRLATSDPDAVLAAQQSEDTSAFARARTLAWWGDLRAVPAEVLKVLLAFASGEDRFARESALDALLRLPNNPGAARLLTTVILSRTPRDLVPAAIEYIGRSGDPLHTPVLIRALSRTRAGSPQAEEVVRALRRLTGQARGTDAGAWRAWWRAREKNADPER